MPIELVSRDEDPQQLRKRKAYWHFAHESSKKSKNTRNKNLFVGNTKVKSQFASRISRRSHTRQTAKHHKKTRSHGKWTNLPLLGCGCWLGWSRLGLNFDKWQLHKKPHSRIDKGNAEMCQELFGSSGSAAHTWKANELQYKLQDVLKKEKRKIYWSTRTMRKRVAPWSLDPRTPTSERSVLDFCHSATVPHSRWLLALYLLHQWRHLNPIYLGSC